MPTPGGRAQNCTIPAGLQRFRRATRVFIAVDHAREVGEDERLDAEDFHRSIRSCPSSESSERSQRIQPRFVCSSRVARNTGRAARS